MLGKFKSRHRDARAWLDKWYVVVKAARWSALADVRQTFSSADAVEVSSGRTVTVFNACGNKYRLITAIHYNTGKVFVLMFLTHAEYDKDLWKGRL